MKFQNKLNRAQTAGAFCSGASLGMSAFVYSSAPVIGVLLGIITVGVCLMIFSGKWRVTK